MPHKMRNGRKVRPKIKIAGPLKLNLNDYDYMEGLNLEGWAWEFIRRNKTYKTIYQQLKEKPSNEVISRKIDELKNKFSIKPQAYYSYHNLNTTRFLKIQENYKPGVDLWIPNPDIKFNEFSIIFESLNIIGAYPFCIVEIPYSVLKDGKVPPDDCYKIINEFLTLSSPHNMLYVGINLRATKEEVMRTMDFYIDQFLEPREVRKLPEWKIYLFVYDLFTNLLEAYPQMSFSDLYAAFIEAYDTFHVIKDYEPAWERRRTHL